MTQRNAIGEALIEDLAETLQIPQSRYEAADRSYRSVADWLDRPASVFAGVDLDVYTQGSFRLGTAIRPVSEDEHYDLDVVCEFDLGKWDRTQAQLHADLGRELKSYAARYGMEDPSPWDRCWTLNYADEAQFHMDVLPSVPDSKRRRLIREQEFSSYDYVKDAISITDAQHHNYRRLSDDWPASNPKGYAAWFLGRMRPVFESRRKAMAIQARADVADIPTYRVRTPLQSAIQILKRHRDMRFVDEPEGRPSSIVITTLAAHAYGQESTITGALLSILDRMDAYVECRSGEWWIANPSDPRENFADAWNDEPSKQVAFDDWLQTSRADFAAASRLGDATEFVDVLAPRIGRDLVEAAVARRRGVQRSTVTFAAQANRAMRRVLDAPHRRPPGWPVYREGSVDIVTATAMRDGFRPHVFSSGEPITRGSELRFDARTEVKRPFEVFWQVVNTGEAAKQARDLRGGFDVGDVTPGVLSREETATYPGSHSIECIIVKEGLLAARSGPFLVTIG